MLQVLTVRDILKYGVSDHMGARVDLEELAMKALKYNMAEGFTVADLNEQVVISVQSSLSHIIIRQGCAGSSVGTPCPVIYAIADAEAVQMGVSGLELLLMALAWGVQDRHYVSEEYKKEVLEHMSIHQLIDTILINPTVHVSPSYRDTGLSASYTFKPLSNLVYTRDQQVIF